MDKIERIVHYVQEEYIIEGEWWFLSRYREINERNPELILQDESVVRFRFYDMVYYENMDEDGIIFNVSKWIYVGKRISYERLKKVSFVDGKSKIALENMINKGFLEFVNKGFNQVSYNERLNITIPMTNDDLTIDEYINEIGNSENIKRNKH